jgi:thymidine kinase
MYNPHVKPGVLEVFCGPMKSGKTREVIHRVDKLQYMEDFTLLVVKPSIDTRDATVRSRFGKLSVDCEFVDDPVEILELFGNQQVVVIDEANFFNEDIVRIVQELLVRDVHVIVAGLDLDFRGEPFGSMPTLLALADEVHKLTGVCDVSGCNSVSTRTQRLVNDAPAHYDSPIILVGDENEGYQTRCRIHHVVPRG